MGAGTYPAGTGPAGHDPIVPSTPNDATYPAALRYDGYTKNWLFDDANRMRAITPVAQKMAIGLCFRKGSIKGAPQVGNTYYQIQYVDADNLALDIEQRTRSAVPVAQCLADREAEIIRIEHWVNRTTGQLIIAVDFYDLIADPERSQAIRVTNSR